MTKKKLTGAAPNLGGRAATPLPTPVPFLPRRKVPQIRKGLGDSVCHKWKTCEGKGGWGEEAHFTECEDGTQPLFISLINIWAYKADLGCLRGKDNLIKYFRRP